MFRSFKTENGVNGGFQRNGGKKKSGFHSVKKLPQEDSLESLESLIC